jgi:hypothetical protein
MVNRTLLNVRLVCKGKTIGSNDDTFISVYVHWLDLYCDWVEFNYDVIVNEISRMVAENVDEIEKRAKLEAKTTFKEMANSKLLTMAVALCLRDSNAYSIVSLGNDDSVAPNSVIASVDYGIKAWIAPPAGAGRQVEQEKWPVDCVC